MSTELEQLRTRAEAAEHWQHTFAGLGGTPEIAWAFHKGLENNKIAWQLRAEDAEARVTELERDNALIQMELDASCNAEVLRQVREALDETLRRWDSDRAVFCGALQLLKEAGPSPGSTELIEAAGRFFAKTEANQ